MSLLQSQARPGAPAQWLIGAAGSGEADIHPVRIVEVAFGVDDRGRQGLVATVIRLVTAQAMNGGGTYPKEQNILLRNLDVRPSDEFPEPIAGFDDVDIMALWGQVQADRKTFLLSGGQSSTARAAALVAAGVASPDEADGLPPIE